jgi:hypothetical protein
MCALTRKIPAVEFVSKRFSGIRLGSVRQVDLRTRVEAAAEAALVRQKFVTPVEVCVGTGVPRGEARDRVSQDIDRVLDGWE